MFKRNLYGHAAFVNPGICFAVRGVFASDSGIIGDATGDFATVLLQEEPTGSAPFFALTSGMPSENAADTIITWFEETHLSGRTTLAENVDSSETGIDVADGSSFVAGVIAMIESTGEYVFVTAVSGNTLTVVRAFATTTASGAALSGDGIQRIATAYEEGSSKPVAVANVGSPRFNYVEIFRNVWSLTGTAQAIAFRTGNKLSKNKGDAARLHAEDIERALLFGRKTVGSVNGTRFSTMDGIRAIVSTNVVAAGSTTDWKDIDDWLRGIFEKNIKGKPNERIAFAGNGALSVLNDIVRIEGTLQIQTGQTDFGLDVNRWITPYGRITLMTHPLMVENPLWTKDIDVIHPGAVMMKWLRRTFDDDYNTDGTRAGVDADYGVITSELSFKYGVEKTGGRFTGLTAGAAVP